eukprot:364148-Chlamydomonas_euryale.AAC.2
MHRFSPSTSPVVRVGGAVPIAVLLTGTWQHPVGWLTFADNKGHAGIAKMQLAAAQRFIGSYYGLCARLLIAIWVGFTEGRCERAAGGPLTRPSPEKGRKKRSGADGQVEPPPRVVAAGRLGSRTRKSAASKRPPPRTSRARSGLRGSVWQRGGRAARHRATANESENGRQP